MSFKAKIHRDYKEQLTGASYMFAGLNTIIDPYNLPIDKGWLPVANNVDIDNSNSVSRRNGYTQKIASTNCHSGWSNNDIALFVKDGTLVSFNGATTNLVDIVNGNLHMWYTQVNDVIVYSNGIDWGIIGGVNKQETTYSPDFKINTEFGTNLEFYNGRVYHAKQNSVYCTDVFDIEHSDLRHQNIATFKDKITMIRRVEDGLYIGTESMTFFLKGNDIVDGGFSQLIIADYGVVLGTDISTNGEYFPNSKSNNQIAVWTSERGICSGGANGNFVNHSITTISVPECTQGAALLRDIGGFRQYITTLTGSTDEYNPYPQPTFDINSVVV